MRENVAPILAAHFRGNVLAGNTLYIDPVSGFITALLPVLKEKVDNVIAGVANDPKLLSRFVKQLLTFDETIRDSFSYDAGNLELGWKGLTWEVLDTWFDRWLEAEKQFALQSTYFKPLYLVSDCLKSRTCLSTIFCTLGAIIGTIFDQSPYF